MLQKVQVLEYIWIDAEDDLRSKTKVLYENHIKTVEDCPVWNFDGSSTKQASGNYSDVFLKPVRLYKDPFRVEVGESFLVLCECYDDYKCTQPNSFNNREKLQKIQQKNQVEECWAGIEQEYVIYDMKTELPYNWKTSKNPGNGPQGPYYCGVGAKNVYGRSIIEEHMYKCIEAGVKYHGNNAEVMPSQWEF